MTASEIFSKLNEHQLTGMMFHEEMADYFDFLNLMGFKRMHEYHFLLETCEMRGVHRYYLNHFNRLIPDAQLTNPSVIPTSWYNYERCDVDASTKKKAIRDSFSKWRDWEESTKELYEQSYKDLCDIREVAAAMKVKELICGVDCELKGVDRMYIKLESIDYDLPTIYIEQDDLHSHYEREEKEIGITIC